MIDVDNKILYFGYGDIRVSNKNSLGICFKEFVPPVEVGTVLTDEFIYENGIEFTTDWQTLYLTNFKELCELEQLLKQVEMQDILKFTFKDFTFDFTNYNKKSVEIVLSNLAVVRNSLLMCYAA